MFDVLLQENYMIYELRTVIKITLLGKYWKKEQNLFQGPTKQKLMTVSMMEIMSLFQIDNKLNIPYSFYFLESETLDRRSQTIPKIAIPVNY